MAATTWDVRQICQNLDANLCEEVKLWWNSQLSEVTCLELVAHPNGIEEWCKTLEKHFRILLSEAWNKFNSIRYIIEDVKNCCSSTEYIITFMAVTKSCDQGKSEFGLVIQAWMHIDMSLQQDIDESKNETSIKDFVNTLLIKQINWYNSYLCNSWSDRFIQQNQQGQYDCDNHDQDNYGCQSFSYSSYSPSRYGNSSYSLRPQWQPNNQSQQFQPCLQGTLSNAQLSFKTSLQIIFRNERSSSEINTSNQRFENQAKKLFNCLNRDNKFPWWDNHNEYSD